MQSSNLFVCEFLSGLFVCFLIEELDVVNFPNDFFFCQAHKAGLFGSKIVWMFPNWFSLSWYKTEDLSIACSPQDRQAVVEGALYLGQAYEHPFNETGLAGFTFPKFDHEFRRWTRDLPPSGHESMRASYFDSVWAAAMGLNLTLAKLRDTGEFVVQYINDFPVY